MAIKVTGTTVINDSRAFENLTDIPQIIRKPSILSPTDNETDTEFSGLVIEGSSFQATYGNNRDYREFQVDLATGDFSTPVVSQQVNSDSLTLTTDLNFSESYKVRIRDIDLDGNISDFSDVVSFTTEADPLTVLGGSTSGGFYMGTICAAGTCYYLIVAPNATGCASCQWKTSNTSTSGTCSLDDGYANTYPALENSTHPAGNWTATRTIGGFSDWYLPSIDELEVFYNNGGGNGSGDPLPSGEDFETDPVRPEGGYGNNEFWSSTEGGSDTAYKISFGSGITFLNYKTDFYKVRAVRRFPV